MLFETRSEQISDDIDNMRKQPQFSLKRDTSLTTNSLEKSVANSTYSTGSSKGASDFPVYDILLLYRAIALSCEIR